MRFLTKLLAVAALALLAGASIAFAAVGTAPAVAVIRMAACVPGDVAREGAAEMLVLLEIARVRHQSEQAGLVAVGDRRGVFPAGAEDALHQAVLRGVPVVKLGRGGSVLAAPHGLFLDGGSLSEEEAARVLCRCLERYGRLPAEAAQLRERLRQFQDEFTLATSTRLAAR
jgi:hypothetical protein